MDQSANPIITRWSHDIPYIYAKGNCKYWQPETLANFETSMHAHYLGLRLAWGTTLDPASIVKELNDKFYGAAAMPMTAYWQAISCR